MEFVDRDLITKSKLSFLVHEEGADDIDRGVGAGAEFEDGVGELGFLGTEEFDDGEGDDK